MILWTLEFRIYLNFLPDLWDASENSGWVGDCGDLKFSLLPNGLDVWKLQRIINN